MFRSFGTRWTSEPVTPVHLGDCRRDMSSSSQCTATSWCFATKLGRTRPVRSQSSVTFYAPRRCRWFSTTRCQQGRRRPPTGTRVGLRFTDAQPGRPRRTRRTDGRPGRCWGRTSRLVPLRFWQGFSIGWMASVSRTPTRREAWIDRCRLRPGRWRLPHQTPGPGPAIPTAHWTPETRQSCS